MAGTTVKIKQSSVASKIPAAGDISQGELALNTTDQKLYSKDGSGTIFEIGSGSGVAGANEIVTTDFTATNNQTDFSVSYSYLNDHVNVYYNGVHLSTTDFTATNGTTVVLDTGATTGDLITIEVIKALALANGSEIDEYEFTATASQTSFAISSGYNTTSSDIEVYVNGVKIPTADFTATNGTSVVLGTACAVNDQVAVRVIKVVALASVVNTTSDTGAAIIPVGTTAQRDGSPLAGYLRWNSTLNRAEIYNDNTSAWQDVGQQTLTTEEVQDIIGGMVSSNTETDLTITYDDTNGKIDFALDLSDAEIKTAYENNSDTNAYTDAEQTKVGNLSGTNTGDQTITLTGDVTGSGTGSFAATIAADAVTYAKIQNVSATDRILGRDTAGAGVIEEITPANLRTMINVEDGATADQTAAEIRTLVGSATDSNVYDDAAVTKLSNIEASADVTDATNVADAGAVMESDTTTASMSFVVDEDNMASNLATKVPTQQSVKAYVDTQIGGENTLAEDDDVNITSPGDASLLLYDTGTSTWRDAALSGDATIGDTGVITVSADAITYAKMQNVVADERILGRVSGANGVVEELTKAQTLTMLNVEDGATGDQTAAEIKTAYESNSDTNEYSDAEQTKVSNLSGTNTGDQTITLTGDVTGSGTGSFAGTIKDDVALGGNPTTTTQSASNNTTRIATTAYVDAQVATVVDSAPAALNTLNELADALGDDANYATTTATSIGTKLPKAGGEMTGNITMSGTETVDGRDLSVDGAKLDLIEASAKDDQTAAEIRTLVGSATDSNVYDDAAVTKLSGIEASADVTDATNVNAAGALMLSDTTTSGLGIVVDEDNMASDSATKVPTQQSVKAYVDAEVAAKDALSELSGTLDDITDGTTYKRMSATEQTKLSNIETSADVTDATNVAAAGAVMESDTTIASMSFVVDEDDMTSDSATKLSTQQAIKAYVDAQIQTVPDAVAMAIALG